MSKWKDGDLRVLTANDLLSGDVVYFTKARKWSRSLDDALLADTPEDVKVLEALVTSGEVEAATASAYVVDLTRQDDGKVRPAHYREAIRTFGPTVRPDFGPQSVRQAVPQSGHQSVGADHV